MSYSSTVLADSPSAYYRLDEASGNLADSSGNGHTLNTLSGVTYGVAGLIASDASDNAISLSGGTASSSYAPATTASWTLEWWMKPSSVAAGNTLVIQGNGCWRVGFNTTGKLRFTTIGHTDYDFSTATFSTSTTYHVVMIFGSSATDLYVNGSLSQSVSGSGISGAAALVIGGNYSGVIDEVAFYEGVALSSTRIAAHYSAAAAAPAANSGFFGLMSRAHDAWERRKSGILVPRIWTPDPAYVL